MANLAPAYNERLALNIEGRFADIPFEANNQTIDTLADEQHRTFCVNAHELSPAHSYASGMMVLNILYAQCIDGATQEDIQQLEEEAQLFRSPIELSRVLDVHAIQPLPWLHKTLRTATEHYPERLDLLERYADAFSRTGELEHLCITLEVICKSKLASVERRLQLADAYLQRALYQKAQDLLEVGLGIYGDDKRLLGALARAYQKDDPKAHAARLASVRQKLTKAYPKSDENWRRLAEAKTVLKDYVPAGCAYLRASQTGTGASDVLRAVSSFLTAGQKKRALDALSTLTAADSGLSAAQSAKVERLIQSLRPAKAAKTSTAASTHPDRSQGHAVPPQESQETSLEAMQREFVAARVQLRPWFEREAAKQAMLQASPTVSVAKAATSGPSVPTRPSRHAGAKKSAGRKNTDKQQSFRPAVAAPTQLQPLPNVEVAPVLKNWIQQLAAKPAELAGSPAAVRVQVRVGDQLLPATYCGESADGEWVVRQDGAQQLTFGAVLEQPPEVSTQVLESVPLHDQHTPSAAVAKLLSASLDVECAVNKGRRITVGDVLAALDADPRCQVVVAGGVARDGIDYAHGLSKEPPKIKDHDIYVAVPIADALDLVEELVGPGKITSPPNTLAYGMATIAGIDIRSIQIAGFYAPRTSVEGRSGKIPPAIFGADISKALHSVDACCNAVGWMPSVNRLLDPTGRGISDIVTKTLSVPDRALCRQNRSWVWRYCIMRLRGWIPSQGVVEFAREEALRHLGQSHADEAVAQAYRGDMVNQVIRALQKNSGAELLGIMREDGFDAKVLGVVRALLEEMAGSRSGTLSAFAPNFRSASGEEDRSWARRLFGDTDPNRGAQPRPIQGSVGISAVSHDPKSTVHGLRDRLRRDPSDGSDHTKLIKALAQQPLASAAAFIDMLDAGFKPSWGIYKDVLVRVAATGLQEEVVNVVKQAQERNYVTTPIIFLDVLLTFIDFQPPEATFALFARLRDLGVYADDVVYTSLIRRLTFVGLIDLVDKVAADAKATGLISHVDVRKAILWANLDARRWDMSVAVMQDLPDTARHWGQLTVIVQMYEAGEYRRIIEVFAKTDCRFDVQMKVIEAYRKLKEYAAAVQLCDTLIDKKSVRGLDGDYLWTIKLHCLFHVDRDAFNLMQTSAPFDSQSPAYARLACLRIFAEMVPADVAETRRILSECYRKGGGLTQDITRALKQLNRMVSYDN